MKTRTGDRPFNNVEMGRHHLDPTLSPPLKALFVYNHNPLVVHPDQNRTRRALAREDLFKEGRGAGKNESLAPADAELTAPRHFVEHAIYPSFRTHRLHRAEPPME